MSSIRNRSHHSPQVNQRILEHDLEGAGEALMAFDGFQSEGPELETMVLQRPSGPQQPGLLQQLLKKVNNLFAFVRSRR
ncbi:hypothetical protein [Synechococcus sp. WH 8016]|uniref:hypothetical protein n=1 Tax=Synechococcus sp. WH 8016 TaxID=166318 RepID=UPI00022D9C96|nr:hypothetical protein [Synechococcus sp. WH 8016]EHA60490.1 hypothetical protein Syn8016DRAFT_2277 [Synechococcus sp. WH 8016]